MGIESVMEGLIFLGLTELNREGCASGIGGGRAQYGELLVDVANVLVFGQQLLDEG